MKILVINGSPRGERSNTPAAFRTAVRQGFLPSNPDGT